MDSSLQLRERLGERIRELRRERGLSLRQVATSVGCSAAALSYIENGRNRPSVDLLARLAQQLDATFESVLGGALPPSVSVPDASRGIPVAFSQFLLAPGDRRVHADGPRTGTVEIVFVVEGQLTLWLGAAVYTLSAGSSVQFDDGRAVYVNQGAEPAVVVRGRVERLTRGLTSVAS
jgi:transcriptional regulator with XRE-family HTH domain